ncbi:MAG: MBL fold metallo-hydrolase [Alphaproteobacteria bacterium]|nr:MBL fold metallo-hydrolase [Alphaproteobacteria bacterium]
MLFAVILVICLVVVAYLQLPMFGQLPHGDRLVRIERSPNYKNGCFHNMLETPVMVESFISYMKDFFSRKRKNFKPSYVIPSIKTDLRNIDIDENILVWFGHSSYFAQINGKKFLIDPLFSEISSPILFSPRAFEGTNIYSTEDMPDLDYLVITHDHWDHLDYKTVVKLRDRVRKVICPLGVGASLELWGFDSKQIREMDWYDSEKSSDGNFVIYCLPSRHFSGRGLMRNKTLWASFLICADNLKVYFSGDSGYDEHFAEIENRFGPMDIVMLDSGQHDLAWRYIHMQTNEVIKAAKDLKAKVLIPAHICKLALANHAWDEPLNELAEMMKNENFSMVVPMIGEKVNLKNPTQLNKNWWKKNREDR